MTDTPRPAAALCAAVRQSLLSDPRCKLAGAKNALCCQTKLEGRGSAAAFPIQLLGRSEQLVDSLLSGQ